MRQSRKKFRKQERNLQEFVVPSTQYKFSTQEIDSENIFLMGVILFFHLYRHLMELSGSPFMFKIFILKMRSAAILVSPSQESKGLLPSFVCPTQFPLILYQMLSYHKSTMHYVNVNYFAECHSVAVTTKGSSRTTIRPSRMHVLVHNHQGTPRRLKIIHPS